MKGVWKFVGGCFVGAASAIVVSPRSGREVRRQIARKLAAGLERGATEGGARTQVAGVPPAGLREAPPAPAATITEQLPAEPAVAVAEPEMVAETAEPETVATVVEPETVAAVAGPETVAAVAEPETAVEIAEPETAVEPTLVAEPEAVAASIEPEAIAVAAEPEAVVEAVEPEVETALEPPVEDLAAPVTLPETAASFDDLASEPLAPVAPLPGEPLEHPGLEDLRARIEQTKAAVREALERPFAAEAGPADAGGPVEEMRPVAEQPEPVIVAEPEPVIAAEPEPVIAAEPEPAEAKAEPTVVLEEPAEEPATEMPTATPEATLVTQIEAALEPPEVGSMPALAPPSPPEEAGVWVVPEASASGDAHVSGEGAVDVASQVHSGEAQPGLDQAVADAFAFEDETAEADAPVVDQAEMRRRIEETRARLKAKAFDAMTSGEAALLARESSEQPVAPAPEEEATTLDDEVRQVIDRSLSQDDL